MYTCVHTYAHELHIGTTSTYHYSMHMHILLCILCEIVNVVVNSVTSLLVQLYNINK